jgi:hypothetical protein
LVDSGNWHTATNFFKLQRETYTSYQEKEQQANFCYQLIGLPLSVISSRLPIEMEKQHILACVTETVFLRFKEQVPFKCEDKISAVQCKRKTFRLVSH